MTDKRHSPPFTTAVAPETGWKLPFFVIWGGQAASLLGSSLVQFALVWWLVEQTESATVLALAMLMAVLPRVFLGPLAGAFVDRYSRRRVMLLADGAIALATIVLAGLFVLEVVQPWHIYVILLVRATGEAFHLPAMNASTTLLVPERHLTRIGGLNQALTGVMNIAAPPLAALLLGVLPMQAILGLDVVTAFIAILALAAIPIPNPQQTLAARGVLATVRADFAAGLRYVWDWPALRALMVLAMLINLTTYPATALLPILVREHFNGDALHLGWIQAGWGVGLLVGGLILGAWGGFRQRIATSMTGLIGMGIGFLVIGVLPGTVFGGALAAMTWAGVMTAIHGGPIFAALQATVEPAMQGRVLAMITSAFTAVVPLSLILAGPLADALGVNIWYMLSGILAILLGMGAFAHPVLMGFEDGRVMPAVPSDQPHAAQSF